jgi:hypothetical protein
MKTISDPKNSEKPEFMMSEIPSEEIGRVMAQEQWDKKNQNELPCLEQINEELEVANIKPSNSLDHSETRIKENVDNQII